MANPLLASPRDMAFFGARRAMLDRYKNNRRRVPLGLEPFDEIEDTADSSLTQPFQSSAQLPPIGGNQSAQGGVAQQTHAPPLAASQSFRNPLRGALAGGVPTDQSRVAGAASDQDQLVQQTLAYVNAVREMLKQQNRAQLTPQDEENIRQYGKLLNNAEWAALDRAIAAGDAVGARVLLGNLEAKARGQQEADMLAEQTLPGPNTIRNVPDSTLAKLTETWQPTADNPVRSTSSWNLIASENIRRASEAQKAREAAAKERIEQLIAQPSERAVTRPQVSPGEINAFLGRPPRTREEQEAAISHIIRNKPEYRELLQRARTAFENPTTQANPVYGGIDRSALPTLPSRAELDAQEGRAPSGVNRTIQPRQLTDQELAYRMRAGYNPVAIATARLMENVAKTGQLSPEAAAILGIPMPNVQEELAQLIRQNRLDDAERLLRAQAQSNANSNDNDAWRQEKANLDGQLATMKLFDEAIMALSSRMDVIRAKPQLSPADRIELQDMEDRKATMQRQRDALAAGVMVQLDKNNAVLPQPVNQTQGAQPQAGQNPVLPQWSGSASANSGTANPIIPSQQQSVLPQQPGPVPANNNGQPIMGAQEASGRKQTTDQLPSQNGNALSANTVSLSLADPERQRLVFGKSTTDDLHTIGAMLGGTVGADDSIPIASSDGTQLRVPATELRIALPIVADDFGSARDIQQGRATVAATPVVVDKKTNTPYYLTVQGKQLTLVRAPEIQGRFAMAVDDLRRNVNVVPVRVKSSNGETQFAFYSKAGERVGQGKQGNAVPIDVFVPVADAVANGKVFYLVDRGGGPARDLGFITPFSVMYDKLPPDTDRRGKIREVLGIDPKTVSEKEQIALLREAISRGLLKAF